MTPQSTALQDFPVHSRTASAARIPYARRFFWSVRRELWENHSLYVGPSAVAALCVAGFLIAMVHMRMHPFDSPHMTPEFLAVQPYIFAAMVIMIVSLIVAFFYSLDALYGERRDRSILFWKSLPVSDLTTVLSKAAIPILVMPLITFVVTIATQAAMLLIAAVALAGTGLNDTTHTPLLRGAGMLLYHLVALHGLYYAPIFGWLLLVSAWARKAPLLWAVLPPLALSVFERIAFHSAYFSEVMVSRLVGGRDAMSTQAGGHTMSLGEYWPGSTPHLLVSPGMVIGLFVAALLLLAAERIRRYRMPL